jgi:NADH-quinone oxidoreductase subunit E
MLRRLHPVQPDSFAFTPANQAWAEAQITKYPAGRQASAIIPLLWRAQEQEGWLSRPAIEHVADMLGMAYIRALEVATFYFMFQLQPTGSVAHVQICGTLSCMICGAEDLIEVVHSRIARTPFTLSADGKFTWEEVECLGSCSNAPMVQIGKDYYEDLTAEKFAWILDELAAGRVPTPGPQNGRFAAEPLGGVTSLHGARTEAHNGSVALALEIGDTVKRIDGTEVPLLAPWQGKGDTKPVSTRKGVAPTPKPKVEPAPVAVPVAAVAEAVGTKPATLDAPRGGMADDLKRIKGVGPKLEALLHRLGFFHFAQVAGWTESELAWVDANLEGFKGRASRDEWVAQARVLAAGGETEFSARQ